jgi:hypothetical protein
MAKVEGRKPKGAGAVDNGGAAGPETAEDQGGTEGSAVEKDVGRTTFTLDDGARERLRQARELDTAASDAAGGTPTTEKELAFWSEVAPTLEANPVTVEPADDVLESGTFTAWPLGSEPEREFDPATNEKDHDAAIERIERIVASADLQLDTLGGDIRDVLIDVHRNRHKPWGALSKDEQRDVCTAYDYAAKTLARRVVALVAADGRATITAQLATHTNKGGGEIEAKIKIVAADDSAILALAHATGRQIAIIMADAEPYLGQRRDPPIEEDQRGLAFEAGSDSEAAAPAGDGDLAQAGAAVAEEEALFTQAVDLVRGEEEVNLAFIQRKLEIGHTPATAIVERMEREGMLSAADDDGQRKVLIKPEAEAEPERQPEAAE